MLSFLDSERCNSNFSVIVKKQKVKSYRISEILKVKMTRHGRNATNASVYSYHERKKDAAQSGYGSDKARFGKDSVKGFDCCSLTLQPCATPVVTKEGWLYDKEVILKYMLDKKTEYARKLKEYERQKNEDLKELQELAEAEKAAQVDRFEKAEKNIKSKGTQDSKDKNKPALPSFWIPSLTPQASKTKVEKPDKTVYCPMSGKPLKMKDLIEVKFQLIKPDEKDAKKSIIAREERYKCAVTHDVLNNATPCAVLKPTGDVVTVECVEKIIKPDMRHPLTDHSLKESDIIYLHRGGTGYSAANDQLEAKKNRPSMAIA